MVHAAVLARLRKRALAQQPDTSPRPVSSLALVASDHSLVWGLKQRISRLRTHRRIQDLVLLSREDKDLGVASHAPPGSQASPRGEAKDPLSSRVATRISWCPLSGLKGVQPPLPFGERTRDCSPGHAGKEGPQLARTGVSEPPGKSFKI